MDWVTKRLGFSTTIKPRQIPSMMPAVYGVEDGMMRRMSPNEPDGGAEAAAKEAARLHPPVRGSS